MPEIRKFVVGGAVRDTLMGVTPKDVDYVVVGSTPEEMLEAGFKQVGADFPVFLDEAGVEYALARTERKNGKGYNGFATDHSTSVTLEDDLLRRDLTINAMAMGLDMDAYRRGDLAACPLFDPFGGQTDLMNKVLRHVSEAFADDPVRVLRLARFHARFGPDWTVDPGTMALMRGMVECGELSHLTRERVLKELEKALGEPYPYMFFRTMEACDAMEVVLPEMRVSDWNYSYALQRHEGGSAKFRYSRLSLAMNNPEAFEERLNVSTEWRRYAKMFREAFASHNDFMPAVHVLYRMDAYRQADLWEEMIAEFLENNFTQYSADLIYAWNVTKGINFASLTEEQRATLKGPAIAEAIKKRRMDAVC